MAHELTIREDGKVEMAFRVGGEFPWHFKETNPAQVPADATVEEWVHAAGMEWTVERAAVNFSPRGAEMREYTGKEVLYRSDTNAPLGVVTPDYNIINPRECIEFFTDLVQSVGLVLDTAGTLFGGRRFWALAKVDEQCMIGDLDKHKGFLLLTSSADGLRATEARFTDVRVVCANTLAYSEKDCAGQVRITHRTEWNPDEVKRQLGVAPASFTTFMMNMRRLADVRLTDEQAQEHVKIILGKEEAERGKEGKTFPRVMDLFRGLAMGADLPGVAGTAYGLLNAFTEALDHKSRAINDSRRMESAMMGVGARTKVAFRDQLLELVA
jgi:phage/plasmid-like protein (TIGR03299 family)